MNKKLYFPLIVLALLLGLPSLSLSHVGPSFLAQDGDEGHEILFSIPVGDDGIHYAEDGPDMYRWGPAAITVAPDGSFWIADTAGNRLLHYDLKGVLLDKISMEDLVVGASDIEVTSREIWVLGEASQPPKIVHMALDGKNLGIYELPKGLHLEDGLSGIALGEDNQVLIVRESDKLTQFLTADGKVDLEPLEGYVDGGKIYTAQLVDWQSGGTSHGFITAGDIRIEVNVTNELVGLRVLGTHPDGSFFVIVDELVTIEGALRVDQTVWHYNPFGELLGKARVPLAEQYVNVAHGLAIGPDGAVYALITKPDHAEVQRLRFSPELKPILPVPPAEDAKDNTEPLGNALTTCRSRDTMMSTASGYTSNYRYLNNTNINGSCSGRGKPRYLGSAGNYYSVSYDWGGFDAVSAWNNFMANNNQAGDIDTHGAEPCSKGVDCSGFVSRVWGLPEQYGTCSLETISTVISRSQLLRGDIMNRCYPIPRHVILFSSFSSDGKGMLGYESTTHNERDRVAYTYRPWTGISDYVPRKYNSVCP
ncbi:MAG: hypothetical protein ABIL11_03350 [Chloroflexota bacterium]